MSSCFLCDTSYKMKDDDKYYVYYAQGQREYHFIKHMPIMVGSSGFSVGSVGITSNGSDQQHNNNDKQNYYSYRVNKIEFRSTFVETYADIQKEIPSYIILFKVPLERVMFNFYYIEDMKEFILYSNPECILSYCICPRQMIPVPTRRQRFPDKYDLIVNKPFIVGPNDYVGVLYFFGSQRNIDSSAKVWFDVV